MFGRLLPKRTAGPARDGAVAIVLQATGSHAWAVSGGWVQAAARLGVLGAEVAPRARWGAPAPEEDGGLGRWLRRAGPEHLAILLGLDWHSQALHRSKRWRERLARSAARKLLYVQESLGASRRGGSEAMLDAFRSAAELCDGVLFADATDGALVEAAGKPSLWLPFGVDTEVFRAETPFGARRRRAFFRGKLEPFGAANEYAERRRLVEHLRAQGLVEVIPYRSGAVSVAELAADFNRFQIALSLPSVFAGHPTRVLEGMASGCCVVAHRSGVPAADALFEDGVELVYYAGEAELEAAVRRLAAEPAEAALLAERGRRAAARFSLDRQLARVLDWAERAVARRGHG